MTSVISFHRVCFVFCSLLCGLQSLLVTFHTHLNIITSPIDLFMSTRTVSPSTPMKSGSSHRNCAPFGACFGVVAIPSISSSMEHSICSRRNSRSLLSHSFPSNCCRRLLLRHCPHHPLFPANSSMASTVFFGTRRSFQTAGPLTVPRIFSYPIMPEKVASAAKEGVSSWRETTRTERIDWTAIERHAKMEGTNGIVFRMAGKGGNSETVRICVFFCERMKRPSKKQCVILTRDPRGGKEKEGGTEI